MAKKSAVIVVQAEGTDKFNSQMNKSADSVRKFGTAGKQSSSMISAFSNSMGSSIAALAKMVPAIGAVTGGLAAFNKAMRSTESMSDAFDRNTRALTSSIDSLFAKVMSGNFSGFIDGLKDVANNAKEAYNAIDNLGTLTSFQDADLAGIQTKRLQTQLEIRKGQKAGKSSAELKPLYDQLLGYDSQIQYMAEDKARYATEAYNKALREAVSGASFYMGGRTHTISTDYVEQLAKEWAGQWDDGNGKGFKYIDEEIERQSKAVDDAEAKWKAAHNSDGGMHVSEYSSWTSERTRLEALKMIKEQEAKIVEAKEYTKIAEQAIQQSLQTQIQSIKIIKEESKEAEKQVYKLAERISYTGGIDIYAGKRSGKRSISGTMLGNSLSAQAGRGSSKTVNEVALEGISGTSSNFSYIEKIGDDAQESSVEVSSLVGSVTALGDAFSNLNDTFEDTNSVWDLFKKTATFMISVMSSLNTITSAFSTTKTAETSATLASATASTIDATAKSADATASITSASAASVDATAKAAETAAAAADATMQTVDASSKAMNAHSYIPFVGVALGAAAVAGIIAVLTSLPKFETGGVVGGSSYSGDKLLARVNSGEGILTAQGMKNLNNMLSSSQNGGNVKFEIEGRKLVGVLNNYQYNRSSLL